MPRKPRSLHDLLLSPKHTSPPRSPSPTFSDATRASAMNFGADGPEKIITRANLKASLQAFDELMNSSANYRAALLHMSKMTAAFADAMEKCAVLKGPSYEAGTRLQAASGLHHLVSNHWHILAEALDKNFEKPLRQHLDTYRTIVNERSASYEKALLERSGIIRQTEIGKLRTKPRNLQNFREALAVLQRQVDELDALKAQHYQEIMEHEEEVWGVVQAKVCIAVRSTMDVFDRFTAKASDPVLEHMLQSVPDPFHAYGPPQAEDQIFTILPPLAVIANAPSSTQSPLTDPGSSYTPTEWGDVPSPFTPPCSTSPPSATARKANHQSRLSDSKLRSVVVPADKSSSRHNAESSDAAGQPDLHGGISPEHDAWNVTSLPYSDITNGDETPPHSPTPEAALDSDGQSDHTVHLQPL